MLEISYENLMQVVNLKKSDMINRDKWIIITPTNKWTYKIPGDSTERGQFIRDWLTVCPEGTLKKLEDYEVEIRRKAIKKGMQINDKQIKVLLVRKIAMIKKDYSSQHYDLVKRMIEYFDTQDQGFTYLEEIINYLDLILRDTEKKFPNLIVMLEEKTPRRKV